MTRLLLLISIYTAAITHGIQPEVAVAVCFVESSFRPQVVNKGCYGLCQVNYTVWKSLLVANRPLDKNRLLSPMYNLDAGMTILRHYLDKEHGNVEMALFRYNNGYKHNNRKYAPKVLKEYKKIRGVSGCN